MLRHPGKRNALKKEQPWQIVYLLVHAWMRLESVMLSLLARAMPRAKNKVRSQVLVLESSPPHMFGSNAGITAWRRARRAVNAQQRRSSESAWVTTGRDPVRGSRSEERAMVRRVPVHRPPRQDMAPAWPAASQRALKMPCFVKWP